MELGECGGNETSQTDREVRLEPGRGWRLWDQWGGKSTRESTRPELVLDVEKERTRRSVKVK